MDLITDDLDQNDSGLESLTASKGDTPERKPMDSSSPSTTELETFAFPSMTPTEGALKEYDDEPDESLYERLWGLSEMFPECLRNCAYIASTKTYCGVKSLYGLSRSVMWVVASSSVILFAPVIFEVERAQMSELEKSQQKQVLLGTNTALSGPMPAMPPMPR